MYNSHAILPQDEALDNFRSLFPVVCEKVTVSDDGMTMKYRVMSDRLAAEWILLANRLIKENRLPLFCEIDEFKFGSILFDRWLTIQFVGVLTELPCY